MPPQRALEDLINGDTRAITPCLLEKENLEAVRRECILQERYESGRNSVGVYFLELESVLELYVGASIGRFA